MSRTELFRQRQTPCIGRESADDDRARAGLLGRDCTGESLLAGPLDYHDLADLQAALQVGPFDAVAEWQRERRELRRPAIGHAVKNGVRVQILELAVAAPKRRRDRDRRRAVADGVGFGRTVERVRLVAQAEV